MNLNVATDRLTKSFGAVKALDEISTRFASGLHGLIGPEGAGKTTLFRCLLNLLKPDFGLVRYYDVTQEVSLLGVRERISYMPSQQSLYPDLTIDEHLNFFRDLYALSAQEFKNKREELLHVTRLAPFIARKARELSGGMYKKLGLMCALLQSPEILFLDEPTNGVDPVSRREFWDLLYQLKERNIVIVIATAYMDEAERCDLVHLISAGRLFAEGEPRSLLEQAGIGGFDAFFIAHEKQSLGIKALEEKERR